MESHRREEAHFMMSGQSRNMPTRAQNQWPCTQEGASHKHRFSGQDRLRIDVSNTYLQGDQNAKRPTARAKSKQSFKTASL